MKQKTVMLYLNSLHRGGAERVFVQLAERFAANGWRAILVTSYTPPDHVEYPVSERVVRCNMEPELILQSRLRRNTSRIAKLRRLLREYRPDILVTCMQEPNFRGMVASFGLPVKRLVSVCNASEKEYPGKLGLLVGKVLMPMAEGCVFQTEQERAWFPKRLQKKSRIIMNQVTPGFFDIHYDGPRHGIVTVGRLNEQKNQALLIRAFARIADKVEDDLLLYGDGELRGELQALIDALKLGGRVRLMGVSTDVANAIKGAKLFALSSDYEGVPNAVMEAMALGLPCVCTDCLGGGPAMLLDGGRAGVLVPMRDEQALAEAMLRLLQDPAEAARLGAAARERAAAFRPDAVFAQWEDYVRSIIGKDTSA